MEKEDLKDDPKQKLINRIEKEKLYYRESFKLSVENNYEYCSTLSFDEKHKAHNGGLFIYGPKFTDYTELEQAYCMAHELGHHHVNEKMNSFMLKVSDYKLPIVVEVIEYFAWKEAEVICSEENIKVDYEFYSLRKKCLNTYKAELSKLLRSFFEFVIHIFISYYKILLVTYLMYSCSKNNIIDLFGAVNQFRDIDVMKVSKVWWITYTSYRVLEIVTRGILKIIKKGRKK